MMLVGALVATASICIDLNDPFGGAFRITPSSEQLRGIRELVEHTLGSDHVEQALGRDDPQVPPHAQHDAAPQQQQQATRADARPLVPTL